MLINMSARVLDTFLGTRGSISYTVLQSSEKDDFKYLHVILKLKLCYNNTTIKETEHVFVDLTETDCFLPLLTIFPFRI